ncbi:aminoglycoside 6'-N-acetyltransferase [Sphingobium sp. CR28]|uniref:aminoglycoside 6'-N-acetyltransferase n=1 Tax=Sphingobium sp. CR28 TaxID=3400272 RepID=UPI003FEEE373
MRISVATAADLSDMAALRSALWPDSDMADLKDLEAQRWFLARCDDGTPAGFAEVALRQDYVNGCDHSPVAFLEGIYVAPAYRRQGIARALVDAALDWARDEGVREFASDALIDNRESHAFHAAIGFEETERVVYFRRLIERPQG